MFIVANDRRNKLNSMFCRTRSKGTEDVVWKIEKKLCLIVQNAVYFISTITHSEKTKVYIDTAGWKSTKMFSSEQLIFSFYLQNNIMCLR